MKKFGQKNNNTGPNETFNTLTDRYGSLAGTAMSNVSPLKPKPYDWSEDYGYPNNGYTESGAYDWATEVDTPKATVNPSTELVAEKPKTATEIFDAKIEEAKRIREAKRKKAASIASGIIMDSTVYTGGGEGVSKPVTNWPEALRKYRDFIKTTTDLNPNTFQDPGSLDVPGVTDDSEEP